MDLKGLLDYLQPVIGFLGENPYMKALVVFVLSLAIANILAMLISKVFLRLAKRTNNSLDNKIIELLHRPLFWTVVVLGTLLAIHLLTFSPGLYKILSALLGTILVILWSHFILQILRIVLRKLSKRNKANSLIRKQTLPLFENIMFLLVLALAVYLVFTAWGIDMTAWMASAGIVGIAIGFAAKDTLSNLFSGVFIMADTPYKIGDYIVLESGQRGKVTNIGIRSTRLLTREDVEITIPNAIIGNTSITNESGGPHEKFRTSVKVSVAYGSDIDKVRQILMDIGISQPDVCEDPKPRVRFRNFGDSGLDFELLCWVYKPEVRGSVLDVLNSNVYKAFNKENIEIPYAKRDIYIKEMPNQTI